MNLPNSLPISFFSLNHFCKVNTPLGQYIRGHHSIMDVKMNLYRIFTLNRYAVDHVWKIWILQQHQCEWDFKKFLEFKLKNKALYSPPPVLPWQYFSSSLVFSQPASKMKSHPMWLLQPITYDVTASLEASYIEKMGGP